MRLAALQRVTPDLESLTARIRERRMAELRAFLLLEGGGAGGPGSARSGRGENENPPLALTSPPPGTAAASSPPRDGKEAIARPGPVPRGEGEGEGGDAPPLLVASASASAAPAGPGAVISNGSAPAAKRQAKAGALGAGALEALKNIAAHHCSKASRDRFRLFGVRPLISSLTHSVTCFLVPDPRRDS